MIKHTPSYYEFETLSSPFPISNEHDTWEVYQILSGSGVLTTKDNQITFHTGEVFLIPPHVAYEYHFNRSTKTDQEKEPLAYRVSYHDHILDKYSTILSQVKAYINNIREEHAIIQYFATQATPITRYLWKMKDAEEQHRASALLKLLLLLSDRSKGPLSQEITKSIQEQNIFDQVNLFVIWNAHKRLTLNDVANHVNMSRFSFCAFFKKYTGKTFFTYLEEYRINLACRMLKEENTSIANICYRSGFNDIPHFNRTFKRIMGVSPKEYRAQKE